MREFILDENNKWEENAVPTSNIQDQNIHSIFIFENLQSNENLPSEESFDFLTITYLLNTNEIRFQKDDDDEKVIGSIIQLRITNFDDDEETYKLKIIFKANERICVYVIPHSSLAFPNESILSPETPEEFITMLNKFGATTENDVGDEESKTNEPSRLKKQLNSLYDSLKQAPRKITLPQIKCINIEKLRHSFVKRPKIPLRIAELKSQIEQKLFDYNLNPITVIEDNGMYDVVDGNQILAAILELKEEGKPCPTQLKSKIYEKNPFVNPLELALFNESKKKEFPLSYLDKVEIVRKYLELKKICRDSASTRNPNEVKKIFDHLFPSSINFRSLQLLVGVNADTFEKLLDVSQKFSRNEICYSVDKECDPQYKFQNIQLLNSDRFWQTISHGLKLNSPFILQQLSKLSNTYGILELLEDIANVPLNLHQQLQNSKITYSKTLEEAITEFGMPNTTTVEQCCFLLSNRNIQKQATTDRIGRTLDTCDKMKAVAKSRIAEFLGHVNTVTCEHADSIPNLENFNFVLSFDQLNWQNIILPEKCLIFDLCEENDRNLGRQNLSTVWNIKIIREKIQKPVDGRLPNISTSLKIFYHSTENEEGNQYARQLFQQKVETKNIKTGTVIEKNEIVQLFHLTENGANCLIFKPPFEWIEILAEACFNCGCNLITIVTADEEVFDKFKTIINDSVTNQWHAKAKELTEQPKSNKRKRRSTASVDSQPPSPDAAPKSRKKKRSNNQLATQSEQLEIE